MPDRVGEILNKHRHKKSGIYGMTTPRAIVELLEVVLESLPKKRDGSDGVGVCSINCYNRTLDDVIEAMERLFGKENL